MAIRNKAKTLAAPAYIDFEPECKLSEEGEANTLTINLPGFKKEQLRVQVNNLGILKVSGERPNNAEGISISRFLKETKIPEGCDVNDIRAKFTNSELHVIMPKKVTTPPQVPQQQQQQEQASTSSAAPQSDGTQESKAEAPVLSNQAEKTGPIVGQSQLGSLLPTLLKRKIVPVSLGVAMVTMVAIGAYVAYKHGALSTFSPSYIEETG